MPIRDEHKLLFSQNLLRLLAEYEKSQIEVANAIGVSHQTFSTWCRGIAIPRASRLKALAAYFGVSVSVLMEGVNPYTEEPAAPVLTEREAAHLEKCRALNDLGWKKIEERTDELLEVEKYLKKGGSMSSPSLWMASA